ncbi:MAG: hypothetical protein FJ359_02720 [Thaumarchaeota archaeon]|nr:hypothetical protein [Nitrososphaerota archaeon]
MTKDIPKWVTDEIQNAKFGKPQSVSRTGYILDIYEQDNKIDAQLYESVEDGRYIITLDLSKKIKSSELQKGVVYEFSFDVLKAPLGQKVIEFLKKEKEIDMGAIYQFELKELELLDVGSSAEAPSPEEEE